MMDASPRERMASLKPHLMVAIAVVLIRVIQGRQPI